MQPGNFVKISRRWREKYLCCVDHRPIGQLSPLTSSMQIWSFGSVTLAVSRVTSIGMFSRIYYGYWLKAFSIGLLFWELNIVIGRVKNWHQFIAFKYSSLGISESQVSLTTVIVNVERNRMFGILWGGKQRRYINYPNEWTVTVVIANQEIVSSNPCDGRH